VKDSHLRRMAMKNSFFGRTTSENSYKYEKYDHREQLPENNDSGEQLT
jgi:hypothetical protein